MKKLLIVILAVSSLIGYSQDNVIEKDSISLGTCKTGIQDATSDFKKNIYNSYSYGLTVEIYKKGEEGFSDFYRKYMLEKYSINIENQGCVVTPYKKCYAETAHKLIVEKFGVDIFERTRKEAKIVFINK